MSERDEIAVRISHNPHPPIPRGETLYLTVHGIPYSEHENFCKEFQDYCRIESREIPELQRTLAAREAQLERVREWYENYNRLAVHSELWEELDAILNENKNKK